MKKVVFLLLLVAYTHSKPEQIPTYMREKLEKISAKHKEKEKEFRNNYTSSSFAKTFAISFASTYAINTAIGALGLFAEDKTDKEKGTLTCWLVGANISYFATFLINKIRWKRFTKKQAEVITRSEAERDLKGKGALYEVNPLLINQVHEDAKVTNDVCRKLGSLTGITASLFTLLYLISR